MLPRSGAALPYGRRIQKSGELVRKEWVNTMEKYETLEMEIIFFEGEDVITDSKDDIVTGEQGDD